MSWLLDTCLLSELVKPRPEPKVATWVSSQPETGLHVSTLTLGEIHKGVLLLTDPQKQERVRRWLVATQARFAGRILSVDTGVALQWGTIQAEARKRGFILPVVDSILAATALVHDLTLVTRNTADLRNIQVKVFNPWD